MTFPYWRLDGSFNGFKNRSKHRANSLYESRGNMSVYFLFSEIYVKEIIWIVSFPYVNCSRKCIFLNILSPKLPESIYFIFWNKMHTYKISFYNHAEMRITDTNHFTLHSKKIGISRFIFVLFIPLNARFGIKSNFLPWLLKEME